MAAGPVSYPPSGGAFLTESLDPEHLFAPEQLSAEARLMARTMDEFVRKEVLPVQDRLEAHEGGLLLSLVKKAGELGLLAGSTPEAYDGLGLSKSAMTILSEKSAPNTSFAITIGVHSGIALLPLLYFGTEAQKRKYLPRLASGEMIGAFCLSEAGSGTDALAASTRAVLSPDGIQYLLSGTKMWITNAEIADLFTVFAKVGGEHFTAFLVEKGAPGLSLGREEHKLGLHGSSTRRVILENCAVPLENVLGEVGKGYRPALYCLNIGRFNIGAMALGSAKECLGMAAQYAKQRIQFSKPIAEFGAIRHKLAEMAIRIYALESMIYRTAGYWDSLFDGIDYSNQYDVERLRAATEEYAIECAIVKLTGTETLAYVVDEALQIHGGFGFSEEFPIARQYRDARISRIYEGTNEINRLTLVDQIVKRVAKGRLSLVEVDFDASCSTEQPGDSLSAVSEQIIRLRQVAVSAIAKAMKQLGAGGLAESQEVAMALADICADLYTTESAVLRACRLKEGSAARAMATSAARVFMRDATLRAADKVSYVFAALDSGESCASLLAQLSTAGTRMADTMTLRREISSAVIERGGYPLG